tara:strand:+ start:520 stop:1080 length:561 start_codon:yes stop_codon:yes gene_type:complete
MDNKFAGSNHARRMEKRLIEGETVTIGKALGGKVDTTLRITCMTTPYDGSSRSGGEARVSMELHHILREPLVVKDFKDEDDNFVPLRGMVEELVEEICFGCDQYDDFKLNLEDILFQKLETIYQENKDDMEFYMRLGRRISRYFNQEGTIAFDEENPFEGLNVSQYRDIITDVEASMLDPEALDEK